MLWTHQLEHRKVGLLKTEVLTLFLKMKGMAVYSPNLHFDLVPIYRLQLLSRVH